MEKTMRTLIRVSLATILMVGLLNVIGCGGRDREEAKKEAREARNRAAKLEAQLAQAIQAHENLKAELDVVRQTRDELQKQVDGLKQERDSALGLAQQAEQVITNLSDRAAGQTNTQASLQKQVEDLKAVVAEQQALIEELQAGVPADANLIEDPNLIDVPVDPNEGLEEVQE